MGVGRVGAYQPTPMVQSNFQDQIERTLTQSTCTFFYEIYSLRAFYIIKYQSINQFSGPAYPWGVAGAAARVGASKHLDPLQQRIDALLECQGETN